MAPIRDKAVKAVRLGGLGLRLRAIRGRAGLTQEQACKALGFEGQQGYRRWEAGEVDIPISRLMEAVDVFQTTLRELFKIASEPTIEPHGAETEQLFLTEGEQWLVRSFRSAPSTTQARITRLLKEPHGAR